MADARVAGLGRARGYEDSGSTDASLLRVTLRTTEGLRTTRIAAPEAGGTGSRRELLEYVDRLPDAPRGAREFRPTAPAVLATSGVSAGSASVTPWPLRPLSDGTWTREGRCTVLTDEALTQVQRLARDARQDSRWTSGGSLYAVSFRPLLPDGHTCRDLDVR
ncbi:hypothetical protein [Streptomyces sp. NPDC087859]|uniref:hypothetical protein n=1 Tax=Streptomyces sp. NPDC087859 TaxID=3365812 RepID=UPI0038305C80